MKQISIDSLLETPQDGVIFQKEWTGHSQHGKRSLSLLIALFAGNIGPGLYMISYFYRFYFGLLIAFLIVLIGYGVPHMLFLGKMERFWRAILKPRNSWISRGFILANAFLFFAFLSVAHYLPVNNLTVLQKDSSLFRFILNMGFICAFLLSLYPGFLFSCVRAIPFWNSIILVPLFAVQAFGSGIATACLLFHIPGVSESAMAKLLPLEAVFIVLSAALLGVYLYGRYKISIAGKVSVEQLLYGKYKMIFLFGAVCCEIVIPLMMVALVFAGLKMEVLVAAEFVQLTGILFFKYCLLSGGAYNPIYNVQLFPAAL